MHPHGPTSFARSLQGALIEIKYYQKTFDFLVPGTPFARVVKEVCNGLSECCDVAELAEHTNKLLQHQPAAFCMIEAGWRARSAPLCV
jgi:hypothetical protein